jgi:hypothetical protein
MVPTDTAYRDRATINRENAQHSTGPKTPEGKRRSSLNALRHGLTGQTVVLPGENVSHFEDLFLAFQQDLKPFGQLEKQLVQTIAETQWRINRVASIESNLIALGVHEYAETIDTEDPIIHSALVQAKAVRAEMAQIAMLGLHQTRLTKILHQTLAQLKQAQTTRKEQEEKAFRQAAKIYNLKQELEEPWQPSDDGFEFSTERLEAWIDYDILCDEAHQHHFHHILPVRDVEPDAPVAN